jgi:hypothetical protein
MVELIPERKASCSCLRDPLVLEISMDDFSPSDQLRREFGDIDVYLFDQLLRGRRISGRWPPSSGGGGKA